MILQNINQSKKIFLKQIIVYWTNYKTEFNKKF